MSGRRSLMFGFFAANYERCLLCKVLNHITSNWLANELVEGGFVQGIEPELVHLCYRCRDVCQNSTHCLNREE